jgi:putative peptidoglycan lipid II flippase
MRQFAGGLETAPLVRSLLRLGVAVLLMAALCIGARLTVLADWETLSFSLRAAGLGGTIALAAILYFFVTHCLRVEEAGEFLSLLSRRFGRS